MPLNNIPARAAANVSPESVFLLFFVHDRGKDCFEKKPFFEWKICMERLQHGRSSIDMKKKKQTWKETRKKKLWCLVIQCACVRVHALLVCRVLSCCFYNISLSLACVKKKYSVWVCVPGQEMNLCNICALLLLFLFLSFLFLVRYRSFFYVSEFSCFDFSFFFLLSFLIPPERLNVAVVYFSIVEFLCFNFFISL